MQSVSFTVITNITIRYVQARGFLNAVRQIKNKYPQEKILKAINTISKQFILMNQK